MSTPPLGRLHDTGPLHVTFGSDETADSWDEPLDEDRLGELLEASPDLRAHASATAVLGLALGLGAVVAAPFSLLLGLSVALAVLALVCSVIGLARSSRPLVAGTAMASTGLVLSLVAGAAYGLDVLGVDTSVGDALVPTLRDALASLTDLLPRG